MIAAGLRYFAIVFAVAFAFGTLRTLWLAPAIGATAAVLIELPLILMVSVAAAWPIVRRPRMMTRGEAIGTGAIAFAVLMAAEAALAVFAFGMTMAGWLASLVRMPGPIGLAGQLIFALMPLIVRARLSRFPRQR
ncbi:hypothetical protein [Sphingomonas sp. 28-63-12]|uniref:hypothetical protein n=1 Tax=Sphingomonas sp. 28-63-12 TaxID=1970434 RepID=UPI000BDD71F9|nr:MAG: hypothetical protein B7Y47_15240 [Sphingomonas sp. 28-63-12]